jgi:phage shock protein C
MADHLYRSRDDRMLAGVAGGLAELWDADPSLVRLAWALLVIFTGGIALVVYIVMAIVVPEGVRELPEAELPHRDATPSLDPSPAATPGDWEPSRRETRAARRAARRKRGDSAAPAVIGLFLVMLGGFFLVREWLPQLDFDWFWPLMLIGLGVLLLVFALARRPTDPGATS